MAIDQVDTKGKKLVLVTGGSGLVGRAIAYEVEKDTKVKDKYTFVYLCSKDADLTDEEQASAIFEKYKPNYVINLAARVGGLYANMEQNETFYKVNMDINKNVLHCASEFQLEKCISCLSTCIFPAKIQYPLDETKIHQGPPHESNRGYSLAKRQVDHLNKQYNSSANGSTLFTAIIPTNIYGLHDNFSLEESHVIPGLIHKTYLAVIEAKKTGQRRAELVVCGTGLPLRQFIYANDLAKLALWTLDNYTDTEPLLLVNDENEEISIGHVADIIANTFTRKFNIEVIVRYNIEKSDGQYKKTASNEKLRSLNSEFKFTPIEFGIGEVIEWFCANYPTIRK